MRRAVVFMLAAAMFLTGCMCRELVITSEPAGASVTLNDTPVGRTPVSIAFTYYGVYDVLLTKDGYEPLRTRADASAPVYEYPPFDLAANALPTGVRTTRRWHFTLSPSLESTQTPEELEQGLIERAMQTRQGL